MIFVVASNKKPVLTDLSQKRNVLVGTVRQLRIWFLSIIGFVFSVDCFEKDSPNYRIATRLLLDGF